jgi:hypothetical protein
MADLDPSIQDLEEGGDNEILSIRLTLPAMSGIDWDTYASMLERVAEAVRNTSAGVPLSDEIHSDKPPLTAGRVMRVFLGGVHDDVVIPVKIRVSTMSDETVVVLNQVSEELHAKLVSSPEWAEAKARHREEHPEEEGNHEH